MRVAIHAEVQLTVVVLDETILDSGLFVEIGNIFVALGYLCFILDVCVCLGRVNFAHRLKVSVSIPCIPV